MVVQQMGKTEGGQLEEKIEGKEERSGGRQSEGETHCVPGMFCWICSGGITEKEGLVCEGPLEGYESVCACVCALKKCVFTLKNLCRR